MGDNDVSKYSVIARCLQAASGAIPTDQQGRLLLINEEDDDLMESIMEGSKLIDQDYIASGVKTNTPAAYLYQDSNQVCITSIFDDFKVNHGSAPRILCQRR